MDTLNYISVKDGLVRALRNFLGDRNAIIGISGGIDSAVVASLCAKAVGTSKVIGVQMPYGKQSVKDGTELIEALGISGHIINIEAAVDASFRTLPFAEISKLTNGNRRARERMSTLYAFAGELNGMVIGTSNKTETLLGYFTKYGDGGCDVEPIGDLYKTEVYLLASALGDIPESIMKKAPSAELWEGQTDEGEIGMTYAEMDAILDDMFRKDFFYDRARLIGLYGLDKVEDIEKRVKTSAHKREMPKTFLVR